MRDPIKVLVIDDSLTVRRTLAELIGLDPELTLVGAAADPFEAVELMARNAPDVIALDLEMPRMDGLTFLRKLMQQHPLPVVICSNHATEGADATYQAFAYGAVDFVAKPQIGSAVAFEETRITLCDTLKAAARARRDRLVARAVSRRKLSADAILKKGDPARPIERTERIIVVGASTGGTEAVGTFLEAMPPDAPGIVVVQHMPGQFTASFARHLDSYCRIHVKEAAPDDVVRPGQALIAPGGRHTLIKRRGDGYAIEVRDGPLVARHRPSVDVLFRSAARYAGANAVGVILTGMGDDGAQGMKELRDAGAYTLAQDESTCVVFGMPGEAVRAGGVAEVLPLDRLARASLRVCGLSQP